MFEIEGTTLRKSGSHIRVFLLSVLLLSLISSWGGGAQPAQPPTTDPRCALELATIKKLPTGTEPVAILITELDGQFSPDLIVLNNRPSDCLLNAIESQIDPLKDKLAGLPQDLREKEESQLDKLLGELAGVGTVSTLYGMRDERFWEVAETQLYMEEGVFKVTPQGTLRVEEKFPGVEPSAIVDINSGNECGKVLVANNRSPYIFSLSGKKLENVSFAECDGERECVQGDPSMALGDFNGDGVTDLVLTSAAAFTVTVLRGEGGCKFSRLRDPWPVGKAGDEPRFVTVGDVNNDGKDDLVVANGGILSRTIRVIPGNGDGTFQTPQEFGATERPRAAVIGDFDNDGRPDLIVAGISGLVFLKGDGKGNFAGKAPVGTLSIPEDLAVPIGMVTADLNNDRNLDVAVANYGRGESGSVDVLLGNGDGTFSQASIPMGSGSHPIDVDTVDLDGDLDMDLVAVTQGTDEVVVLVNLGNGSFVRQPRPRLGWGVTTILTGKFNIDTLEDPNVSDLATARLVLEPSGTPVTIPYVDDKIEDTVVAKLIQKITKDFEELQQGGEIQVFYGGVAKDGELGPYKEDKIEKKGKTLNIDPDRDGSFRVLRSDTKADLTLKNKKPIGIYPTSMVSGNFDETRGPGTVPQKQGFAEEQVARREELVVASFGDNTVSSCAVKLPSSVPDRDPRKDELECSELPATQEIPALKQAGPRAVTAGQFNPQEDDHLDLALANFALRNVYLFFGKGASVKGKASALEFDFAGWCKAGETLNAQPTAMAASDFDGDSDDDLAVANHGTGEVLIFENLGKPEERDRCAGTFRLKGSIPVGKFPTSIIATAIIGDVISHITPLDFNNDGYPDLAVTNSASDTVSILLNDGTGLFPEVVNLANEQVKGPVSIVAADFDGDDNQDLAVANFLSNNVILWCGDGQGGFPRSALITEGYNLMDGSPNLKPEEPALKPIRGGPVALAVGFFDDFEENPSPDLAIGVEFPAQTLEAMGVDDKAKATLKKIWQSVFIRYGPLTCEGGQ